MDRGYSCVGRSLTINAARKPNKLAIVEADGLRLTYREFNMLSNRLANYLIGRGGQKGDHIGILSGNTAEHLIALFAIAKMGGVSISLDPKWTVAEISAIQAYVHCKFLICEDIHRHKISDPVASPIVYEIIEFQRDRVNCAFANLLREIREEEPRVSLLDSDASTFLFTSGTTSMPKACIRTNRNIEAGSVKDGQDGIGDTDSELIVVPINFGSGRGRVMRQVYYGGTIHLMESFDARRVADYISRHSIAAVSLAPTMCTRLLSLSNIGAFSFSSLRMLRKAGSPFSSDMTDELIRKITPNVYQAFASTEAQAVTTLHPHEYAMKPRSCGKPLYGVEMEIVSSDRRTVPCGEEGEIRVRGAQVCEGYYNRRDDDRKAFQDGWYYSGDIGRIDEDGYLYVVGRIKDMIKTGSINVSPLEIEQTIQGLTGIHDVCVVGVPDAEWGEAVMAVVVASARQMTPTIIEHCRQTLAPYKIPKFVQYVESIQRNSQGKIAAAFRQACVETHAAARSDRLKTQ
jgi:acyl-CoA synthetase (AMP-forming)/AMP-acid ligase II